MPLPLVLARPLSQAEEEEEAAAQMHRGPNIIQLSGLVAALGPEPVGEATAELAK